jgi:hypothetical protein
LDDIRIANEAEGDTMTEQTIVIRPNQEPQLTGPWTVGQVLQAAELLRQWALSIPLQVAPAEPPVNADRA